jgi:hypothetical protein
MVDTNELSVAKYFITTKSKPSGLLLRICKTSACPEPVGDLSSHSFDLSLIWQLLPLMIVAGILGGLFSMATLYLIKKFIAHTKTKVITIALLLGVVVAIFNYLSAGKIAGSGQFLPISS